MASEERLRELEEKYEDYKVYDNSGAKIGKVDDLFVDETDREEYIGVKLGLLGRKSTLIPMEIVRVNEADKTIEVSDTKDHVKDAPSFDDDEDITSEYERRIRDHFGLESDESSSSQGSYGGHSGGAGAATGATTGASAEEHDDSHDYESRGSTTDGGYSSESTEHQETTSSTAGSGDSGSVPEYQGSGESSDVRASGGSTGIGESLSGTGSSESGSSEGTSSGEPTSRQTEETETFQEGGRTKVRRRIVREEIIEEDPDA